MKSSKTSKQDDASSSKLSVKKSDAKFPRKPFTSLVFMEKFLEKRISKNMSLKTATAELENCGKKWKSMFLPGETHLMKPYEMEAEERNLIYKANMDAYNKWKSMSDNEKAPFIAKAKGGYIGKIAHVMEQMEKTWGKGINDDWNVDEVFDTFAFFAFCEESENQLTECLSGPLYIFFLGFINNYIKQHPEDTRLAHVKTDVDKWWTSVPTDIAKIPHAQWKKMTDAEKAPYFTQAEDLEAEAMTALCAAAIFRNEYIASVSPQGLPEHVTDELWEKKTDEEKAPYLARGKAVIDHFKEEEMKSQ